MKEVTKILNAYLNFTNELKSLKEDFSSFLNSKNELKNQISFLLENNVHTFPLANQKSFNALNYFELVSTIALHSHNLALSFGMHLYTVWGLKHSLLTQEQEEFYFYDVINKGSLFASLNEPGLHFVNSRSLNKNNYSLIATLKSDGTYEINGRKNFVSLEPFVKFLPVYALIYNEREEYIGVNAFIIDKKTSGVLVHNSWDTIAMKDTMSNNISFNKVKVSNENMLFKHGNPFGQNNIFGILYNLSISSVYYGMAEKAFEYICLSSKDKIVPHTNVSLSRFPGVQFTIAEMIILKETMRSQIYHFSHLIDQYLDNSNETKEKNFEHLDNISLITKEYVTKSSEKLINMAMKIEGVSSINSENLLSQLYIDVKAGQFHPPQKDITFEILAKRNLGIISVNKRWC